MAPGWLKVGDFSALPGSARPAALYLRVKYLQCLGKNEAMLTAAQTGLSLCASEQGVRLFELYLRLMCAVACYTLGHADEARRRLFIRFAAELGCPMVDTTDGAAGVPGMTPDEVLRFTIENYRQCLSWAEDYKVILNVDTHGPYTNAPEFMLKLFKHFDSEYLRCNFDTGNTFIAGHDPVEYFKTLQPYITHLHIKDVSPELAAAMRGEDTGIGSSVVPIGGGVNAENIRTIFKLLQAAGWDGVGSIETYGSDDNVRASTAFCRTAIAALA
jgi:sugar phosphate isomerase/epimerase